MACGLDAWFLLVALTENFINRSGLLVEEEELSSLNPLTVIVLKEEEILIEEVDEDDGSNLEVDHDQSKILCHNCGAEFAEEVEMEKHRYSFIPLLVVHVIV